MKTPQSGTEYAFEGSEVGAVLPHVSKSRSDLKNKNFMKLPIPLKPYRRTAKPTFSSVSEERGFLPFTYAKIGFVFLTV